jgi:hypothetical protein
VLPFLNLFVHLDLDNEEMAQFLLDSCDLKQYRVSSYRAKILVLRLYLVEGNVRLYQSLMHNLMPEHTHQVKSRLLFARFMRFWLCVYV